MYVCTYVHITVHGDKINIIISDRKSIRSYIPTKYSFDDMHTVSNKSYIRGKLHDSMGFIQMYRKLLQFLY